MHIEKHFKKNEMHIEKHFGHIEKHSSMCQSVLLINPDRFCQHQASANERGAGGPGGGRNP